MGEEELSAANPIVFAVARDEKTRGEMRETLSEAGFAAIPLSDLESGRDLLRNGAFCHVAVVSADAMKGKDDLDGFLDAGQSRIQLIVHNLPPASELALHCLNRGANDFLGQPFDGRELVRAVKAAAARALGGARSQPDAIVADQPVGGWLELTATSEREQFRRLQSFSDALFASRLPAEVAEDLKLAVEEMGRNAFEWGNRFSPDKRVRISYCRFENRVVIKIEDEGEGFVPRNVPDPTKHPTEVMLKRQRAGKRPGGYGVFLIQKLVDSIVYNDKGNVVLLTKYMPEKD